MRILRGKEAEKAMRWIERAGQEARDATCLKRKCGAVIAKFIEGREILIGGGFNSPPADLEKARRCLCNKGKLDEKVTDKTCCIHAEQRAILDAIFRNAIAKAGYKTIQEIFEDTTIYFASIDAERRILFSGKPYCTICSKMALDVGVCKWALLHQEGIKVYGALEYHRLSLRYRGENENRNS